MGSYLFVCSGEPRKEKVHLPKTLELSLLEVNAYAGREIFYSLPEGNFECITSDPVNQIQVFLYAFKNTTPCSKTDSNEHSKLDKPPIHLAKKGKHGFLIIKVIFPIVVQGINFTLFNVRMYQLVYPVSYCPEVYFVYTYEPAREARTINDVFKDVCAVVEKKNFNTMFNSNSQVRIALFQGVETFTCLGRNLHVVW